MFLNLGILSLKQGKLKMPKTKPRISIRLDADVLEWFKSHGKGYQTRINAVLRTYMDAHKQNPGGCLAVL